MIFSILTGITKHISIIIADLQNIWKNFVKTGGLAVGCHTSLDTLGWLKKGIFANSPTKLDSKELKFDSNCAFDDKLGKR